MVFVDHDRYRKQQGIYRILNVATGCQYIGQAAKDFALRYSAHRAALRNGTHWNQRLLNDWRTYGEDSFVFEVCCVETDQEIRNQLEQQYISDAFAAGPCYNKQRGGGVASGYQLSEATRQKMRDNSTHAPCSEEHKEALRRYKTDRPVSDITKKKLSEMYQGEKSLTAILSNQQAADIKKALMNGAKLKQLADMYGVRIGVISYIAQGLTFQQVPVDGWDEYVRRRREEHSDRHGDAYWGRSLSVAQVQEIQRRLMEGEDLEYIGSAMSIPTPTVSGIAAGRTYSSVAIDGWRDYVAYRRDNSRKLRGEKTRKLSRDQVVQVKQDLMAGVSAKELADRYGVRLRYIYSISCDNLSSDVHVDGWEQYREIHRRPHKAKRAQQ